MNGGGSFTCSLGNLVRAWADAGEAPPAAIVAAIVFDLSHHSEDADEETDEVDLDAIWISDDGRPYAEPALSLAALVEVLDHGLSGNHSGRTGDLMPPLARAGLDRFRDWDGDRDDGLAALQAWLRHDFGPLPDPAEVIRCCRASAPLDPRSATLRPASATLRSVTPSASLSEPPTLEVPPLVTSEDSVSEPPPASPQPATPAAPPAPASAPSPVEVVAASASNPTQVEAARSTSSPPEAIEIPSVIEEAPPDSTASDERPVVRKERPRERPVSVVSAPAARRSARPLGAQGDSILVPADGSGVRSWILLLIGVGVAVGLWFLLIE